MKKKLIKSVLVLVTLFVVSLIMCNRVVNNNAHYRVYTDIREIPYNKVGLLLGTSPKLKSGDPNLYFDYRIQAATDLYKANKIDVILISGDNHTADYNEPEEMRKALVNSGVPEEAIYMDYAGLRTLDSIIRAKEIFGQTQLTIISQQFHNERAIYLAGFNDIDAIGYNAKDVSTYSGLKTQVRELFARVKMFIDLGINKQPHFLGESIIIK